MEISRVIQGGNSQVVGESSRNASTKSEQGSRQPEEYNNAVRGDEQLSNESAKKVVEGLNNVMSAFNSHLKFVYHEKLQKYYVTIVDSRTEEVVREVPPKKLLDFVADVNKKIGLIVDQKV